MDIYFHDNVTGRLTGNGKADWNPVSKKHDIIPAFATTERPPQVDKDHMPIFKDGGWTIIARPKQDSMEKALTEAEQIEQANAEIKFQIAVVEEQGIRAMREFALYGNDESRKRLQEIDDQIAELREKLK